MAGVELKNILEIPEIRELSRALWRVGDLRGAAVMVGAGFSLNADLPGPTSRQSPTWHRLVLAMREALGSDSSETDGALEIAQQYEAVFGRQALDGLIREHVPDLALQPGSLHRRLLRLPWSEVLTTNYDTLLERCAEQSPGQTFEVVRSQSDIPRTRSPRIVKLHGSLPSGPFVIASEDYRTYLTQRAAMVNLVQQVLLENHLVLLGFSATDPNFQAWTGWVRDNLGEAARRLILVGLFDMSAGTRRVLDSRGVTIVDLSIFVSEEDEENRHGLALERFLMALEKAKPPRPGSWKLQAPPADVMGPIPGSSHEGATGPQHWYKIDAARRRLEERIPAWVIDRQSYRGWVVAPHHARFAIQHSIISDEANISAAIKSLVEKDQHRAVFELAWRFDVAMHDLPFWLCDAIEGILNAETATSSLTARELFQAALFALTAAREARVQSRFEALQSWIRRHPINDADLMAAAAYEEALWARDGLEVGRLAELIERIGGRDPMFRLRQAALWCELGAYEQAYTLITHALADLRQRRTRDRHSIWILSRYGWALYIARQAGSSRAIWNSNQPDQVEESDDVWPARELGEAFCDPRDELRDLNEELSEAERRAAERRIAKRPNFDAGAFTHHRHGFKRGTSTAWVVGDAVVRLAAKVGLPSQFGHMIINRTRLVRTLAITDPILDAQLLPLCAMIDKGEGGTIDRFLNRVSVANLSSNIVRDILARALAAVDALLPFLSRQTSGAAERDPHTVGARVGVFLEIASRLVIRLQSAEAAEVLTRGLIWARDPRWQHDWTSEALENLLSRAIEAISQKDQANFLLDISRHPLPGEKQFSHIADRWPEPSQHLKLSPQTPRPKESNFAMCVASLIEKARNGPKLDRERSLLRLEQLYGAGTLEDREIGDFASALWNRLGADGLPTETLFRHFAFLELPQTAHGQAESALRSALLPAGGEVKITENLLDLLSAQRPENCGGRAYFEMTSEEAIRCLDCLLKFCAIPPPKKNELFSRPERALEYIGCALSIGILPVLDISSLGQDRLSQLVNLCKSGSIASSAEAWPQMVRLAREHQSDATAGIIEVTLSNNSERVRAGLRAIERWRVMARAEALPPLPQAFRRVLVGLVATRRFIGLTGALHITANCLRDGIMDAQDISLLLVGLDALAEETTSTEAALEDEAAALRAGTLTLVRRESARLALVMRASDVTSPIVDRWIQQIGEDPFPEVRALLYEPA